MKKQGIVHGQNGTALIITLLLVTVLMSLAVEFAYEVYIEAAALSNWQNAQKASLLSRSGQTLSLNYIKDFKNQPYTYQKGIDVPVEKTFDENGSLTIKVIDENSKFNINSIIYPNGLTNEKALSSLQKLLEYLNIHPSLAMFIADWIDPDSEPRAQDSEYKAKNSYLWSIEELKFIPMLRENKVFETIKPFITVYGNGFININTAELPVLASLHKDMTKTLAEKIIDYRESFPFEDKTHIVRVSGLEDIGIQMQDTITTKSSDFRVITTATVNEIIRVVESVLNTSLSVQYWRET
ncbi:MAG: type II secretion system minor pseudopilin GspK [Nitrospirae bacterium]|nr:type II secretion system minor pseudopilin GspK [Nitrospirota bacterium]